jgi:hypothetical protein
MEKDNTNLPTGTTIKAIFIRAIDREKEYTNGKTQVVMKATGRKTKCMAMASTSQTKEWTYKAGFRMMNTLILQNTRDYQQKILINLIL